MKHNRLLFIIFLAIVTINVELNGCSASNPCFQSPCSGVACTTIPYEGSLNDAGILFDTNIIEQWYLNQPPTLGTFEFVSQGGNGFVFNYQAFPGVSGNDCLIVEGYTQAIRIPGQISVNTLNACVVITIGEPPFLVANPSSLLVCANTPTSGTVTASGFTNADASSISFSLEPEGEPTHGSLGIGIDAMTGGFTYTPDLNYIGPDSFIFTVVNTRTNQVNNNVVTITVSSFPTTTDFTFNSCVGALAAGMLNVSGGSPAYTYITGAESARGVPIGRPGGNSSPLFTYQPSMTGPDFFFFQVEGSGCTSNLSTGSTVVAPPLVAGPVSFTICSNESITQSFSASGGHPGSYSYSIPSSGTGAPTKGTVVVNDNGTFTYTPFAGTSGIDRFSYFFGDGVCNVVSNTITANIEIAPLLQFLPNISLCKDTSVTEIVSNDPPGTLTPSMVSGPSHGTVTFEPFSSGFEYIYDPTVGYVGPDSFIFAAQNPFTNACVATGGVNISVLAIPSANPVSISGCAGTPIPGVLVATGGSGSYQTYIVNQPNPANGRVVQNTQYPNFQYIPTVSFSGADSFSYSVEDTDGCTSATAGVNVFVNKFAQGVSQSLTGCIGQPINGQLSTTGGTGSFTFGIAPTQNTTFLFTSAPIPLSQGTITAFNSTTGSFTYQFTAINPSVETFYFALVGCAEFVLTPVQIIPITSGTVSPISFTTCKSGSYSGNLIVTGNNGPYTFASFNGPNHGTLNPFNATAGTFTYNPTAGFSGQDTFYYKAISASNGCASNSALATITVSNTVAPITQNLTVISCENGSVIGNFTASGGSGNYQYAIISGPTTGTLPLVNSSTGEFVYQAPTNFTGTASFIYSATDVITGCVGSVSTVAITIGCS